MREVSSIIRAFHPKRKFFTIIIIMIIIIDIGKL